MLKSRPADEHLSEVDKDRYYSQQMRADEFIAATDHLKRCVECSERFQDARFLDAAYGLAQALVKKASDDHLPYEQLEGYADGTLNEADRQSAEAHLATCEECESDLQSFFDLRALIDRQEPARDVTTARSRSPGLRRRLRNWWRASAHGLLPQLNPRVLVAATTLVAVIGLSIWTTTLVTRPKITGLESEIAQLQVENQSLREDAAVAQSKVAGLQQLNDELQNEGPVKRLQITDGSGLVRFDESGSIQGLESVPGPLKTLVQNALSTGRLTVTRAPVIRTGQVGTLLGESAKVDGFKLLTPVSEIVLSDTPSFKWEALPGATGYTVLIRDNTTGRELESELLTNTQWDPKNALTRGHTYAWMVEAIKDGRRLRAPALDQPYAGFKVLEKNLFDEIQHARTSWGNSHLVMATLYAKAGLIEASRKELKELQSANPNAAIVRKLINSLEAKR